MHGSYGILSTSFINSSIRSGVLEKEQINTRLFTSAWVFQGRQSLPNTHFRLEELRNENLRLHGLMSWPAIHLSFSGLMQHLDSSQGHRLIALSPIIVALTAGSYMALSRSKNISGLSHAQRLTRTFHVGCSSALTLV
jgi:hypothetical protein